MSTVFSKKCLVPTKRVCLCLKAAREAAGMSVEELEIRTKIHKKYLYAIEECRFEDVRHSLVYQKHFIKKYVEALGQNPTPFLKQFADEESQYTAKRSPQNTICNKKNFTNLPMVLRFGFIGFAVFGVLIYLGFHVYNILQAPKLTIVNPEEGYIAYENTVALSGSTEPETKLSLNGEPIHNNESGNFLEQINLSPGVNTLVITAENKHGKKTEVIRHIIYSTRKHLSRTD